MPGRNRRASTPAAGAGSRTGAGPAPAPRPGGQVRSPSEQFFGHRLGARSALGYTFRESWRNPLPSKALEHRPFVRCTRHLPGFGIDTHRHDAPGRLDASLPRPLEGFLHVRNPHRQRGAGACLPLPERTDPVEPDPGGGDEVGAESRKPRIVQIVRGAPSCRRDRRVRARGALRPVPRRMTSRIMEYISHALRASTTRGAGRTERDDPAPPGSAEDPELAPRDPGRAPWTWERPSLLPRRSRGTRRAALP